MPPAFQATVTRKWRWRVRATNGTNMSAGLLLDEVRLINLRLRAEHEAVRDGDVERLVGEIDPIEESALGEAGRDHDRCDREARAHLDAVELADRALCSVAVEVDERQVAQQPQLLAVVRQVGELAVRAA